MTISKQATWKARVENATLRMEALGGLGVLVPGGFVLTATHCIQWSGTGGMALGDASPEPVRTPDGTQFRLGLAACDPRLRHCRAGRAGQPGLRR